MAITTIGFDGTVNEAQWAALMNAATHQVVTSGFAVTPGAGTRALSVAAGTAYAAGVRVSSSATETVTVAANAGSTDRYDYVVLAINWSTNTTTVSVLTGGATLPALTQTAGSLWHIRLASVRVRPGVTSIAAADISSRAPLPRFAQVHKATGLSVTGMPFNANRALGSISLPDPGWSYHVQAFGVARVRPAGGTVNGYVFGSLQLAGTQFGYGYTPPVITGSGTQPLSVADATGPISGIQRVDFIVGPSDLESGASVDVVTGALTVLQIPA